MPVEIKELVVKAQMISSNSTDNNHEITVTAPKLSAQEEKVLIEECVRQVMAILERKRDW